MPKYKRTLEELRQNAVLHWPNEIRQKASDISVLPKLLETQDAFISIWAAKVWKNTQKT